MGCGHTEVGAVLCRCVARSGQVQPHLHPSVLSHLHPAVWFISDLTYLSTLESQCRLSRLNSLQKLCHCLQVLIGEWESETSFQ